MKPHHRRTSCPSNRLEAVKYRLFPVAQHKALIGNILTMLTTAPNHPTEAAVNAVILHRYADTFNRLHKMSAAERNELLGKFPRCIEVQVHLDQLQQLLDHNAYRQSLRDVHLEQCRWLIEHSASNSTIQCLCFSISDDDIRQMRLDLNRPVNKGRCKSLPLEEKLSAQDCWQQLIHQESNEFKRWQKLAEAYPAYDLAQLYAAVNGL